MKRKPLPVQPVEGGFELWKAGTQAGRDVVSYASSPTTKNLDKALQSLKIYEDSRVEADETIENGYHSIYSTLQNQCLENSNRSEKRKGRVQNIIDHVKDSKKLSDRKIAIDVLKSTNQLLMGEVTAEVYKSEAKKYQRMGYKVLGALMIALGCLMAAASIGLGLTGVGAGVGAGVAISASALIVSGSAFFRSGKVANLLNEGMSGLVEEMANNGHRK